MFSGGSAMRDKPCLVLRATGFLGTHLCEALARSGIRVRAFSRRAAGPGHFSMATGIQCLPGSFHNRQDLGGALEACGPGYHLISSTTPATSHQSPLTDATEHIAGTIRLVEAMRELGVLKIVFVSPGGAIYGVSNHMPVAEDSPTEPISAYGISKLAIEKYLALYQRLAGISYCVLRVANPFGERQPSNRVQGA